MGNLFGVIRRGPKVTRQDWAILQLKQQRDKIKIYQKKTELHLEQNKSLALDLFQKGMKDRALIVLRRKKNIEDILIRIDKQLATLEQLVADIEYTQIEVSVVEGLKAGSEALKQLNSLMSIEDIEQMMEDNAEAAEKQREISEILQRSSERYDDDELAKELDNIVEQQQKAREDIVVDNEPTTSQPEETKPELVDKLNQLPEIPNHLVEEEEETRREEESKEKKVLQAETKPVKILEAS